MTEPEDRQPDRGSWDTEVLRRLGSTSVASATEPSPAVEGAVVGSGGDTPASTQPGSEPEIETGAGGSPWDSRQARRLARRDGTRPWRRRVAVLTGVFRSDDEPERRTEAVTRCQTAVSTGRRVAVVAAHGGAGASTLTVGLGLVLATIRNDFVAVLAGRSDRQVLQHRLGCKQPSSARAVRDLLVAHRSDPNVASLEHLAVPDAPGLRAVTSSDDPAVVTDSADHLSRRHAVTLVDVGPQTDHPVIGSAHGVVVVGRLSLDGVALVHEVLGELVRRVPAARLQVVLNQTGTDSGVTLPVAQKLLGSYGVPVSALPPDLHLATGTTVSLSLLSGPATVALTEVAAQALDIVSARS